MKLPVPVAASCPAYSPLPAHPGRWPSWSSPTHGEKATSSHHRNGPPNTAGRATIWPRFPRPRGCSFGTELDTWSIMTFSSSMARTHKPCQSLYLTVTSNKYPKSLPFHLSTWRFNFLQLCITSRLWGTPRWADRQDGRIAFLLKQGWDKLI